MTPAEKHAQNQGRTEPLPDALRDMLSGGSPQPIPAKKPATHRTGTETRSWANRPLSKTQKVTLSRIAEAAFKVQEKHGLIDSGIKVEAWRRAEAIAHVGFRISHAKQSHYLPLRGHFLALAGKTDIGTFNDLTAQPDAPDRAAIAQALRDELARFAQLPNDLDGGPTGDHAAEAYLFSIAQHRGNLHPRTVATITDTWKPEKIETLVITLRNRIAAKLGVGNPRNRNKSQRG